ncbi:hypothetical protein [Deefgea piscis]|uniref:hypothetical protein n=1 Tax=Deefgea piscis TaxID=2739061 RepID=UPI001C8004A8|nr:hypothetical protein [Deefgea piscis]QZA82557.1 hypothetical protein K4H25_07980 [Deefgea piscis]
MKNDHLNNGRGDSCVLDSAFSGLSAADYRLIDALEVEHINDLQPEEVYVCVNH